MIKNVIFDCGKVLVQYDETYIASFFVDNAEDAELLGRVGMARKYWDRFDKGELKENEYLISVKKELPEHLHASVEQLSEHWIDHCDAIPGMADIVMDVKKNCKVYLLSNFNKKLRNEIHKVPVLKEFDGLVISGEVKLVKPNQAIYQYLLDTYHLKAEECIFVDDNAANIAAGESVGIRGYLFDGDVEKLRAHLTALSIIS
jgi:putative hydrolase of the HAD superfamily